MSRLRLPPATRRRTSRSRVGQRLFAHVLGELRRDLGGMRLRPACTWRIDVGELARRHALQHVAARAGGQRPLDLDVALEAW